MHGQMIEPQEPKQSISSLATIFLTGSPPVGAPSNHQRIGQLIAGFSKVEIRDPQYVRAQQAFSESLSRFRSLLEDAELIAIKLNEQGDLTYCNKFFLQFTGWRREEVLGRSWCDLFIPPGQYSSELYKAQIATGFVLEQWDSEILTKDRLPRMISWSNTILLDSAAKPIGSASIGQPSSENRGVRAHWRQVVEIFAKYVGNENILGTSSEFARTQNSLTSTL
jgi:PAS domain S-box-containing protein